MSFAGEEYPLDRRKAPPRPLLQAPLGAASKLRSPMRLIPKREMLQRVGVRLPHDLASGCGRRLSLGLPVSASDHVASDELEQWMADSAALSGEGPG